MDCQYHILYYKTNLSKTRTSGSTRGNNGTVQAGLGDNVHLNGGVTARVVHGTSVNLGDRHYDELGLNKTIQVSELKDGEKRKRKRRNVEEEDGE